MGQIWRQSEVTQFLASVGRVIDQNWSGLNFCQSMLVRVVYELSDRRGFFHDHVGFPFRPFTDLLCVHGYHSALYTLNLH